MVTVACKECGFAIRVTGKGRPDYNVKSDNAAFVQKCKTFANKVTPGEKNIPLTQHMTNCSHLRKAATAALLPDAL